MGEYIQEIKWRTDRLEIRPYRIKFQDKDKIKMEDTTEDKASLTQIKMKSDKVKDKDQIKDNKNKNRSRDKILRQDKDQKTSRGRLRRYT